MRTRAVIILGPPGSGKGQQADLLADVLGLIHIDTGKVLRAIFADPEQLKSPVNRREKKLNDAGFLNTPRWVVNVLAKKLKAIAKLGYGIAFSGSPRTLYEAERILPLLEALYGRRAIRVFFLDVPLRVAARRNRNRYVCTVCKRSLLTQYYPAKHPKSCPVCAGVLARRTDDDPKKFAVRTNEYHTRTAPVIAYTRERGYRVTAIDGTRAPFRVFRSIVAHLNGSD